MKALVVIDYTHDFVIGRLPCGQPAIDIERRIAELTEQFAARGEFVAMAVDVHDEQDPYHPETALFPPHNIRGTEGRELYGALREVYERHASAIYWMDKTRYSSFCGTDLDMRLRARGVKEVHLVGVCTDICVLHTAIEAYNLGYRIVVHEDAVASFNADAHRWALEHVRNTLGAQVVSGS
ncbi:cysteine hydrolase [Paenibacillus thiaminolyticus]|uniref:cysteine hydrolase family protein n=1 Tax=Paenibacillus thiaminolyticus TaxID=49283 RepID=UPI0011655572|nr:isochorismatase family cysteine hydrolase [Paenibacillus thiaminolyticus]MDG0871068.1 cysteine hydrolase [Paenibacillus thiaminolyticus]NGP62655.1 cysteine hydrolase [Paenibacillus thiaminolyticus]